MSKSVDILLFAFAAVGILVMVNVLTHRHPWRWDLTANKQHSLSQQTLQLLGQLKEPIQVWAFMRKEQENPHLKQMEDILKSYQRHGPQLAYEIVDFENRPELAREYGVTQLNSVVFVRGGKRKIVSPQEVFGEEGAQLVFLGEQAFTNALLTVLEEKPTVVYFTEGHGEWLLDNDREQGASFLRTALISEHRIVKSINLALAQRWPADCEVLVIVGPRKPFNPRERTMIKNYLAGGGKLLVALELLGDPSNLEGLLGEYGLATMRRLVIDPERSPSFDRAPTQVIPFYRSHPIVDKLAEARMLSLWETAMWLREEKNRGRGMEVQTIMETSPNSWAEAGVRRDTFKKDAEDDRGPLAVAMVVSRVFEKPINQVEEGTKGRPSSVPTLVVFGDADFLSNQGVFSSPGNKDLFLNSVSWLLAERVKIAIRPKSAELRRIRPLTETDASVVLWTSVIGTPLLIAMVGLVVWGRRRAS